MFSRYNCAANTAQNPEVAQIRQVDSIGTENGALAVPQSSVLPEDDVVVTAAGGHKTFVDACGSRVSYFEGEVSP